MNLLYHGCSFLGTKQLTKGRNKNLTFFLGEEPLVEAKSLILRDNKQLILRIGKHNFTLSDLDIYTNIETHALSARWSIDGIGDAITIIKDQYEKRLYSSEEVVSRLAHHKDAKTISSYLKKIRAKDFIENYPYEPEVRHYTIDEAGITLYIGSGAVYYKVLVEAGQIVKTVRYRFNRTTNVFVAEDKFNNCLKNNPAFKMYLRLDYTKHIHSVRVGYTDTKVTKFDLESINEEITLVL